MKVYSWRRKNSSDKELRNLQTGLSYDKGGGRGGWGQIDVTEASSGEARVSKEDFGSGSLDLHLSYCGASSGDYRRLKVQRVVFLFFFLLSKKFLRGVFGVSLPFGIPNLDAIFGSLSFSVCLEMMGRVRKWIKFSLWPTL